jgi:hypothetical protein
MGSKPQTQQSRAVVAVENTHEGYRWKEVCRIWRRKDENQQGFPPREAKSRQGENLKSAPKLSATCIQAPCSKMEALVLTAWCRRDLSFCLRK